jgi:predicted ATPase
MRQRELARLDTLLTTARLIAVTGPGGVGKTRLSVALIPYLAVNA